MKDDAHNRPDEIEPARSEEIESSADEDTEETPEVRETQDGQDSQNSDTDTDAGADAPAAEGPDRAEHAEPEKAESSRDSGSHPMPASKSSGQWTVTLPQPPEPPEPSERPGPQERPEPEEQPDRPARHERQEQPERPEPERPERPARHQRQDPPEQPEPEKRPERPERPPQHERQEQHERPARQEQPQRQERPGRPEATPFRSASPTVEDRLPTVQAPKPDAPAHEEDAPRSSGPHPTTPHTSGSHPYGPDSGGEPSGGPRTSGTHPTTPRTSGPHEEGPRRGGRHEAAPRTSGPHEAAPGSSGQYQVTPPGSGQHPTTPRTSGQYPATPQTSGQHPATPQTSGQHPVTPRTSGQHPVGPAAHASPPAPPAPTAPPAPAGPRTSFDRPVSPRFSAQAQAEAQARAQAQAQEQGWGTDVTRLDSPINPSQYAVGVQPQQQSQPQPPQQHHQQHPHQEQHAQYQHQAQQHQPYADHYADQRPAPRRDAPVYEEEEPKKGRRGLVITLVAVLVLVVGVVAGQLLRPVPEPSLTLAMTSGSHTFAGQKPTLPWPTAGQATVYVDGLGTMGSSGAASPTPTASVAKVMTAYVILHDKPLRSGESGPTFTMSPQGVAEVPQRRKRGESMLGIYANQQLTQRKALEALLVISANDVAHELARWDTGSDQAFVQKMNEAARSLGMTNTTYTDPSGYDSATVSTAADQVKLLRAAMKLPAFAESVALRQYVPAEGGPARSAGNALLGQHGVVGGKTGYTDKAGGNFVFAARRQVGGVDTLILGAVMNQRSPSAMGAINAAGPLVSAAGNALVSATVAPSGSRVAKVDDGLGGGAGLRAGKALTVVGWPGLTVPFGLAGNPPESAPQGAKIGTLTAGPARVPLTLDAPLGKPSLLHRLLRLA